MIIDNLIVNGLKKQFQEKLTNSRIEKIFQPDKDSFLLQIWDRVKSYKLLISLNSNSYRACITAKSYKIPRQYSPFCLQLKKYLESGYLIGFEQLNFDRILVFKIESFDNVKDKVNFLLIIELTGKYSNLILADENYKVIACFKQVDETQSEERQILVGQNYEPITNKSGKANLNELGEQKFRQLISAFPELSLRKFLVNNFLGISTHTARILLNEINFSDTDNAGKKVWELLPEQQNQLFGVLSGLAGKIKEDSLILNFFVPEADVGGKDELDFTITETGNSPVSDISHVIDNYYYHLATKNNFELFRNELKKVIEKSLGKTRQNISRLEEALQGAKDSEIYKQYGEILLANIYRFPDKTGSLTLENFYDENREVKISLDENLTISENAQKFFKIYNKAKNTQSISTRRLADFQQELEYLEQVETSVSLAENMEDLLEIETELENEKYLTKKKVTARKSTGIDKSNLLTIRSSDGLDIIIGKNNSQNDFLTTKLARENDIWLHTRLIPGSHVVIRTENGQKQVSEKTLLEAAGFAAKYSKAKYSSNVCVIYTKIKFVKKPPRSKPGYVIYSNEKAVYVTPSAST